MPRYRVRVNSAKEDVEERYSRFIEENGVTVLQSSTTGTMLTFYSESLNEDGIRKRLSGLEILSVKEAK